MSRERILVIDDSPTVLRLVQAVLAETGYQVAVASGGQEGLELARAEPPDLILVDAILPDMEGEAVCAALRAEADCASIPVILMGEPGGPDLSARGPRSNIVDAIGKPFTPQALLTVVDLALQGSAVEVAVEPSAAQALTPDSLGVVLSGDLAAVALADVLMLLDRQGQTGVLSVASGAIALRLHLRQGRLDLATAEGVTEEFLLGRFLVRAGALDTPTLLGGLEARRARRAPGGGTPLLGRFLVDRGLILGDDLTRALSMQTAALLYEALRWHEGHFALERTAEPAPAAAEAALGLALPALLLEGFRRVEQWRLIQREVGDLERVFVRDEGMVTGLGRGRLTDEEGAVLDLTDGRRSVRQIVDASGLGAWGAMRMLYRLLQSGLIRPRLAPVALPEL